MGHGHAAVQALAVLLGGDGAVRRRFHRKSHCAVLAGKGGLRLQNRGRVFTGALALPLDRLDQRLQAGNAQDGGALCLGKGHNALERLILPCNGRSVQGHGPLRKLEANGRRGNKAEPIAHGNGGPADKSALGILHILGLKRSVFPSGIVDDRGMAQVGDLPACQGDIVLALKLRCRGDSLLIALIAESHIVHAAHIPDGPIASIQAALDCNGPLQKSLVLL